MGEFHLVHWIVVLGVIAVSIIPWGYPLSRLCRRAGKPPAIGLVVDLVIEHLPVLPERTLQKLRDALAARTTTK